MYRTDRGRYKKYIGEYFETGVNILVTCWVDEIFTLYFKTTSTLTLSFSICLILSALRPLYQPPSLFRCMPMVMNASSPFAASSSLPSSSSTYKTMTQLLYFSFISQRTRTHIYAHKYVCSLYSHLTLTVTYATRFAVYFIGTLFRRHRKPSKGCNHWIQSP